MFVVWAVWALFGFAYSDTVATTTLNVVSKLFSAVAGALIFLPDRRRAPTIRDRSSEPSVDAARAPSTAPE